MEDLIALDVPWCIDPKRRGFLTINQIDRLPTVNFSIAAYITPILVESDKSLKIVATNLVNADSFHMKDDALLAPVTISFRGAEFFRKSFPSIDNACFRRTFDTKPIHDILYLPTKRELCNTAEHICWRDSGSCPNPGLYEVPNSEWLSEAASSAAPGLRHFVMRVAYSYVEILSPNWGWRFDPVQSINRDRGLDTCGLHGLFS